MSFFVTLYEVIDGSYAYVIGKTNMVFYDSLISNKFFVYIVVPQRCDPN